MEKEQGKDARFCALRVCIDAIVGKPDEAVTTLDACRLPSAGDPGARPASPPHPDAENRAVS